MLAGQATHIRLYDEARPVDLAWVKAQPLITFFAVGIVNPAGPTLNAIAAVGTLEPGTTLPLVHLMLNPVSQDLAVVGEISLAETWDAPTLFSQLFSLDYGSCPTLVLPSVLLDDGSGISIFAEFLRTFPDARRVLEDVKQFFGNPWDRVSQEIDRSVAAMKTRGQMPKEPLTQQEAVELAQLLLSEKHTRPELQAFFYAWNGSIKHFARNLATMSFEEFQDVFARVAASCILPISPKSEGSS